MTDCVYLLICYNFYSIPKIRLPMHLYLIIIWFYIQLSYVHRLRQRSKQSRHLRIAKYFHQQFGIYSLRYGNLIFFLFLLMYIRIRIFLIIKGILHSLCIFSPVLINNMTIHFRYHVSLCMSGMSGITQSNFSSACPPVMELCLCAYSVIHFLLVRVIYLIQFFS